MNIEIKTENLKRAIGAIQSICQKKTVSEFTQYALLEVDMKTLTIKGNDLETNVEISIDIENIKEKSKIEKTAINAKIFYDIIKDLEAKSVTILFEENRCKINTIKSDISLNTTNVENFKEEESNAENILKINKKDIISCINYCSPLSSGSIQKSATASILFEIEKKKLKATSTDGHCLSHIEIEYTQNYKSENISFLISKKASSDIKKIIETLSLEEEDIIIGKSHNKIILSGELFSISTKTINEKFPDYKKIINSETKNEISCPRNSFIKTSKRLSLFTENKFIPAILDIDKKKNEINFDIENTSIGKITDTQEISFIKQEQDNEEHINISMYPPYILKAALETDISEDLHIKIINNRKPVIFYANKDSTVMYYIVMPMISV